jgi:hypothetical protein
LDQEAFDQEVYVDNGESYGGQIDSQRHLFAQDDQNYDHKDYYPDQAEGSNLAIEQLPIRVQTIPIAEGGFERSDVVSPQEDTSPLLMLEDPQTILDETPCSPPKTGN